MGRLDDEGRRHDEAGVGPYVRDSAKLVPLRELDDWDVSDTSADVRGWAVHTLGGRELGRVQDLLVDPERQEVLMLEIDLKDSPRTAHTPLRTAQIDRARRVVRVDSADLTGVDLADRSLVDRDREALSRDRDRDGHVADDVVRDAAVTGAAAVGADRTAERIALRRRERQVERDVERDRAASDSAELDRAERQRDRADDEVETRRLADGTEERVVETRPVVVEEVVVRRRTIDPDSGETVRDEDRDAR